MGLDYATLKQELQTDPTTLGYAPLIAVGDCSSCTKLLNKSRSTIAIPRSDVDPQEIIEAINISDFLTTSTPIENEWFSALLRLTSVRIFKANGSDTRMLSNVMKLLVNSSGSETRLRELATRNGSRAEQLFGEGVSIADNDIALALRS
jgi:hypothetical protein